MNVTEIDTNTLRSTLRAGEEKLKVWKNRTKQSLKETRQQLAVLRAELIRRGEPV